MIRAAILAGPLVVALTACSQLGLEGASPPGQDTCGAGMLDRFRGVPASPAVLAEIAAKVGDRTIRTIRPGDAVTMDFRPDRLNVDVGAGGRIERLRCG